MLSCNKILRIFWGLFLNLMVFLSFLFFGCFSCCEVGLRFGFGKMCLVGVLVGFRLFGMFLESVTRNERNLDGFWFWGKV